MMIKITDSFYVAADHVVRVTADSGTGVRITLRDGSTHSVPNDYGKAVYQTMDRLIAEINAATKGEQ